LKREAEERASRAHERARRAAEDYELRLHEDMKKEEQDAEERARLEQLRREAERARRDAAERARREAEERRRRELEALEREREAAERERLDRLRLEEEARLKLIEDARRQLNSMGPQLGIEFIEDSKGVKLTKVIAGKSAARAGLCRGDVIMSVNGYDAINKVEFKRMVMSCKAGDQLIFKVYTHNFTLRTIVVKLGAIETDMDTLEEVRRLAKGKVRKQEILAAKLQMSAQNDGTSTPHTLSPLHHSPSSSSAFTFSSQLQPQQQQQQHQQLDLHNIQSDNNVFSGAQQVASPSSGIVINISDGPPTPHSISSTSSPLNPQLSLLPSSSSSSSNNP